MKVVDGNVNRPVPDEYPLIWAHDAETRIDEPALIRGLILPETLIITYGESNCGKTFHVIDRDLRLAAGHVWYDRQTESGFVIYCATEGGRNIETRVAAYLEHNMKHQAPPPFAILPHSLDLFSPEADTGPLIDFIKRIEDERGLRCVKVTADTVARVMAGGNENSSQDMGALIRNADRIRHDVGCAFEGIHHSGKDTSRGARGHSSLRAAADTEIEVIVKDGIHVARVTKQRDLVIGDEFAFTLRVIEVGRDLYGYPITTCVPIWMMDHKSDAHQSRLTRQEKTALAMIKNVLEKHGQPPPEDVRHGAKPPPNAGQLICTIETLRRHVEETCCLSQSDKPDSQHRALRRCLHALKNKQFIWLFGVYAWLVDEVDKTGPAQLCPPGQCSEGADGPDKPL